MLPVINSRNVQPWQRAEPVPDLRPGPLRSRARAARPTCLALPDVRIYVPRHIARRHVGSRDTGGVWYIERTPHLDLGPRRLAVPLTPDGSSRGQPGIVRYLWSSSCAAATDTGVDSQMALPKKERQRAQHTATPCGHSGGAKGCQFKNKSHRMKVAL